MKTSSPLWIRGVIALVMVTTLVLGSTHAVQAAVIDRDGDVKADEIIDDDLIIGGQTVTIDGTVNGLVLAAGNQVIVNGTIHGDLLAFGAEVVVGPEAIIDGNIFGGARTITIQGQVAGSFFGGAMSLHLDQQASIERNMFFGGFELQAAEKTSVGRDLFAGVYQAVLNGSVARDVNIDGEAIQVYGKIGRNANLTLSASQPADQSNFVFFPMMGMDMPTVVPSGLHIDPAAEISGKLTYTSPVDYSSAIQNQPSGGVVYQTPVPTPVNGNETHPIVSRPSSTSRVMPLVNTLFDGLRKFITLLIVGGLLLWLAPALMQKTVDAAQAKPFPAAGVGFLSILIAYSGAFLAAAVLLGVGLLFTLITLGGLSQLIFGVGFTSLAAIMAIFTALVTLVSRTIVCFLVGEMLVKQVAPNIKWRKAWALFFGVLMYVILSAIPFIGWIFVWAATFVGMGAIWYGLVVKAKPALAVTVENTPPQA